MPIGNQLSHADKDSSSSSAVILSSTVVLRGNHRLWRALLTVTALCLLLTTITRLLLPFFSSIDIVSNKQGVSLPQPKHNSGTILTTLKSQEAASRTFNNAWKQSIGSNITCFRGETFGNLANVTFPKSPHFIIIGAQKAGTTALSTLLQLHPRLKGAKEVEGHFFDQDEKFLRLQHKLDDAANLCQVQKRYYHRYWAPLQEDDLGKLFFEKTPRYLFWPDVPAYLQKVCPWQPKLIAVLRNPIERLYSHHKMNAGRNETTVQFRFDNAINRELWYLREAGLTKAPLLGETQSPHYRYDPADFAIPNMTQNERDHRIRNMLNYNKETAEFWLLQRGMYATQLESFLPQYEVGVNLLVVQYERMHRKPMLVWNEIQDFLQVPRFHLDQDVLRGDYSPTKSKYKEAMSESTREYLKLFFQPYNDRLEDLLGEEWRGVWD